MLNDAAISANPTKYTQNIRHGMYDGTRASMDCGLERCSAPKTANGMAKHKWVRATILSIPQAWTISFFAAASPIATSARPAADIDRAAPENARNWARFVSCMDLPNRYELLKFYDRATLPLVPRQDREMMSEDYDWSAEISKLQIRIRGETEREFQAGFGSAAMILLPFPHYRTRFGSQLGHRRRSFWR